MKQGKKNVFFNQMCKIVDNPYYYENFSKRLICIILHIKFPSLFGGSCLGGNCDREHHPWSFGNRVTFSKIETLFELFCGVKIMNKNEQALLEKPDVKKAEYMKKEAKDVEVFVMGKSYMVPAGLTIMKALEYAGYRFIRGCGCRAGFCGACSTVYRLEDEQKLGFDLACQKLVEDKMYLVQLPFVPAAKAEYDIEKLRPDESTLLTMYPEIARCVSCNTCTKSCPQDIEVMKYIQNAIRGDIAKCAEISFDCIQCGLCAMRCPADIKHYHVSQLARRLRGKYIDTKSKNLAKRLKEIENKKYDGEIGKLMKMAKKDIMKMYSNRKIEAEEAAGDIGGD